MLNYGYGKDDKIVNMYFKEFYDEIKVFVRKEKLIWKGRAKIKYKMVAKKIKLLVLPLALDCEDKTRKTSIQPNLRDLMRIEYELINYYLDGLKMEKTDF